jgi:phage host-nuclease inhibitor protein Gam
MHANRLVEIAIADMLLVHHTVTHSPDSNFTNERNERASGAQQVRDISRKIQRLTTDIHDKHRGVSLGSSMDRMVWPLQLSRTFAGEVKKYPRAQKAGGEGGNCRAFA